jgi:hypothetical protein
LGKEHNMTYLKMALGLALAAGLMAVVASPAMAVPRWVHCVKVTTGQWEDPNCSKKGSTNVYETQAITATSEVTSSGTLKLEDTATKVKLTCTGSNRGWVVNLTTGAGEDGIIEIAASGCKTQEGSAECTEPLFEARNLPWGTRLVEGKRAKEGTKEEVGPEEVRDELISGPKKQEGEGEPGWAVRCTVGGIIKVTDRCEKSGTSQNARNNRETGATEFVFSKEPAKCSFAGGETGKAEGTVISKLRALTALWVLAPNLPNSR